MPMAKDTKAQRFAKICSEKKKRIIFEINRASIFENGFFSKKIAICKCKMVVFQNNIHSANVKWYFSKIKCIPQM
jgi:hypothetical protein